MQPRDSRGTCSGCAEELPARDLRLHVCDWWRWLDHQVELRRDELLGFECELGAYLESPRGQFDLWYAKRERVAPELATQAHRSGDSP
jgi:hypothetical protein